MERYATIAANLAVLIGLMFVAYELRLNNQLLQLEARSAASENAREIGVAYMGDSELVSARLKYSRGEQLSEIESARLATYFWLVFRAWQDEYFYYESGLLDRGPEGQLADKLRSLEDPAVSGHWEVFSEELSPEFVEFIETARRDGI